MTELRHNIVTDDEDVSLWILDQNTSCRCVFSLQMTKATPRRVLPHLWMLCLTTLIVVQLTALQKVHREAIPATNRQARLGWRSNARETNTSSLQNITKEDQINTSTAISGYEPQDTFHNSLDVVHVIWTRFQQYQGHLVHLGQARLDLFSAFCLPTIQAQTSQQFMWIIRIDPELDQEIKKHLFDLVQNVTNILIVASNTSPEMGPGLRNLKKSNTDITPKSVLLGNLDLFRSYQQASKDRIVLETNLDSDDGLDHNFVESVQMQAEEDISSGSSWRLYCIDHHYQWQYAGGIRGTLQAHRGDDHCITPGLTWASKPHVVRVDEYFRRHWFMNKELETCENKEMSACWTFVHGERSPRAIRARTPTSAGMKNVASTSPDKNQALDSQLLWSLAKQQFRISVYDAIATRGRLYASLQNITSDALRGQCTPGHSCKASATKDLNLFLNQSITNEITDNKKK